MKKIIFATKNKDKLKEIKEFFSDLKEVLWLSFNDFNNYPDVLEDRDTIEGNSQKKAISISKFYNLPSLADDTGLFVDYLNGEPGVFSARWAGSGCSYLDNNRKLLDKLKDVPIEKRTAVFRCAITFALPNGFYITEVGEIRGYIAFEMKGSNGFGYDPVFLVPELGKTLAELSLEQKNKISHRFKALEKIKPHIIKFILD